MLDGKNTYLLLIPPLSELLTPISDISRILGTSGPLAVIYSDSPAPGGGNLSDPPYTAAVALSGHIVEDNGFLLSTCSTLCVIIQSRHALLSKEGDQEGSKVKVLKNESSLIREAQPRLIDYFLNRIL